MYFCDFLFQKNTLWIMETISSRYKPLIFGEWCHVTLSQIFVLYNKSPAWISYVHCSNYVGFGAFFSTWQWHFVHWQDWMVWSCLLREIVCNAYLAKIPKKNCHNVCFKGKNQRFFDFFRVESPQKRRPVLEWRIVF